MSFRRAFDTFRGYRHPEFHIIQRRRRWFILSGSAILISIIALVFLGLNYSIDFTGGTLIEYRLSNDVTVEQVRDLLAQDPYARATAEVQVVGGDQVSIRTSPTSPPRNGRSCSRRSRSRPGSVRTTSARRWSGRRGGSRSRDRP